MEPWRGTKRPWEDNNPIESQNKRRDATFNPVAASYSKPVSPHPQQSDDYPRDVHILNQRRLPAPYTSPRFGTAVSAEITQDPGSDHARQRPWPPDTARRRSQSLSNILEHADGQEDSLREGTPVAYVANPGPESSPWTGGLGALRQRRDPGPAPRTAASASCCPPGCQGQDCQDIRILLRELATGLNSLSNRVSLIIGTEQDIANEIQIPHHRGQQDTLRSLLEISQCANVDLQRHIEQQVPHRNPRPVPAETAQTMRKIQQHLEDREEQSYPARQYPSSQERSSFSYPSTTSDPAAFFTTQQTITHAPQPSRASTFPSQSPLTFQNTPILPPISPPASLPQSSPQNAHLQDLQHQISVKTLAFQTLQREYDSLLQKLERQRIKCATLEKKFEVSDVEINSLTDEKEKLQAQIVAFEAQVEELQQSRDEARQQLIANGAQYMRIMEMSNRLQSQGAEDKKKWETEKAELEQRIRMLEEAMVGGTDPTASEADAHASANPTPLSTALSTAPGASGPSQSETINVLRTEVSRLRGRTRSLETALRNMYRESLSIQSAAKGVIEAGGKIESIATNVTGLNFM